MKKTHSKATMLECSQHSTNKTPYTAVDVIIPWKQEFPIKTSLASLFRQPLPRTNDAKTYPRTSSILQIKFSFWSFEISEYILRNQKFIELDSFSNQRLMYLAPFGQLKVAYFQ